MHIIKGESENFDEHDVVREVEYFVWVGRWPVKRRECKTSLESVPNVIEADDQTGLLTVQLMNERGHLLFTNGHDDIALDDSVKVLMLIPPIRDAFLEAGFKPKTLTTYGERIQIRRKGN